MQRRNKIEIIVEANELRRVLRVFADLGVSGYTVLRDVEGKGDRGERSGDELSGIFENVYVMTVCDEAETMPIVDAIRPALKRRGGVCIVSDCLWTKH